MFDLFLQFVQCLLLFLLWLYELFEPQVILYFLIEFLALCFEGLSLVHSRLFQLLQVELGLVSCTICLTSWFYGFLHVLLLHLQLFFQFWVDSTFIVKFTIPSHSSLFSVGWSCLATCYCSHIFHSIFGVLSTIYFHGSIFIFFPLQLGLVAACPPHSC